VNTPDQNVQLDSNIPIPPQSKKGPKMDRTLQQDRAAPPVHESRAYETWDDVDIHAEEGKPWVRPTSLEAPTARKGFIQRWIRVGSMGRDDPTNTARKFREGWKPRPSSTVPAGFHMPTIAHGKWAGCIGVEGMLLCEMPEKMVAKRNAHYRAKTDNVTGAIADELQKHSRPGMPITQERSSNAKLVRVKEDD
jgi:hypothetical protein